MSQHLVSAAENGNLKKVRDLLDRGQEVNWYSKSRKMTALFVAILGRHEEVARLLIERGADVNLAIVGLDQSPLDLAASMGRTVFVSLLLEAGADPRVTRNPFGVTSLMAAAQSDNSDVAERLIAAGAEVNACTTKGETPLTFARRLKRSRMIEILERAGATDGVPNLPPKSIPWPELADGMDATQTSPEMTLWAFIHAMNRWEKASSRKFNEALKTDTVDQANIEIINDLKPIFDQYCTPRDRPLGRCSFGNKPEYNPSIESLIECTLEKPNRAVIITEHESLGSFRYVVMKKAKGWRLDNKKIKGNDTWDSWTL